MKQILKEKLYSFVPHQALIERQREQSVKPVSPSLELPQEISETSDSKELPKENLTEK